MSQVNPTSEAEARTRRGGRSAASARPRSERELRVALEHGRWRHFGWAAIGLGAGGFLIVQLGAVGKGVGVVLALVGAIAAVKFARTLLRPAGTIEIREDAAVLPAGLCRGEAPEVPYERIRHTFFLRRSVPWTRTGPILVVETDDRAFTYPRDWFSSDSDQRRVAHAIHRRIEHP